MEENIYLEEAQEKKQQSDLKYAEIISAITEYKSDTINVDVMGNLLIDLPYKIYSKSLELLDITDEILMIQRKLRIIEDNESQEVSKDPELKNQAQRDAALRLRLLGNETYNMLDKALTKYQRTKSTLNAQTDYLDKLLGGVKIRYRQATAVLINDKSLQEAINNVWYRKHSPGI